MATRTWKIGEYARGGVITVETTKDTVTIIGKDWDFSTGSNRGSSQKNAKEFDRKVITVSDPESYKQALEYLQWLTTSYYADKIVEWIESHVKLNTPHYWFR